MTSFKNIENYIDFIGTIGNDTESEQLTNVLPDNAILLGFQLGEQVYERLGSKKQTMTTSGVCGQLTTRKEYLNTPNSKTLLVKFKPWSAGLFFDGIEDMTDQTQTFRAWFHKKYFIGS